MRWAWAILLLAGGRAERRVVVEDFAKAGLWTDTGEVLGLPESIQPPIGTINLTNEGETLRFDYDVAFTTLYVCTCVSSAANCGERRGATPEPRPVFFLLGESAAGAAGRWETCVEPRHHLADERSTPSARRFQGGPGRVNSPT